MLMRSVLYRRTFLCVKQTPLSKIPRYDRVVYFVLVSSDEEGKGMSTLLRIVIFASCDKEWVKHFPENPPSVEISTVNRKNLKNNGDGKCYTIIIYYILVVYLQ